MNVRKSNYRNFFRAGLAGAVLAALSFNASAGSTVTLDARAPLAATLMPAMKVTASISNPTAEPRWSVYPGRPVKVTLMPTLTITADADALTMAEESSQPQPRTAQADGVRSLVALPANQAPATSDQSSCLATLSGS